MSRWEPDAEGRLMAAAITLFDEQGYDETTVAGIAAAAGLTKRTFFRYFADKREVLFNGSRELQDRWIEGIRQAPEDAGPMTAVFAGLHQVAEMFADRHAFAGMRARIITAHPDLQERELIKLQTLAGAIEAALVDRGVATNAATLAAQAGVTVFHVAFARWVDQGRQVDQNGVAQNGVAQNGVDQNDSAVLRRLLDESLVQLRAVTKT